MTNIAPQNEIITDLSIGTLLSSSEANYIIPIYQRNYAWGVEETHQLIDDIHDYSSSGTNYYIGTLVVAQDKRNPSQFEVIDGQQRLTTLFLLAAYLKIDVKSKLTFESREKSNKTLEAFFSKSNVKTLNHELYSQEIIHGFKVIEEKIKEEWKETFYKYLKEKVILMRVKVPDDTDLNQYFEIMNTRGEQLEKHEIVKAHLLSLLDKGDRHCFNKVWESCANMEKYVQMGFATDERKEIFGDDCLNVLCFTCLKEQLTAYIPDEDEKSIFYLISPSSEKRKENKEGDNQSPKPFNSIINFPNFLLHVLRVMKNSCKDIPLDDKKLIETFKNKITNADDVKKFAFALLKCKYLFDHYIIKIDSSGIASDADGKWCLLRCKLDGSYKNTFGEDQEYNNGENLRILMLLSAFHVSESSMQRKHWLNAALQYLHDCQEPVNAKDYLEHLESIAKCFVFDRILADKDDMQDYDAIIYGENNPRKINRCCTNIGSKISYGNIQNNFIFNYLDYLLWVNNKKYEKFRFTSRNSVEHFLPQDTTYSEKASEEVIDCFGNLCLIHKSDNSSFSNHSPKEKQKSYKGKKIRSIKQDLMMNHVKENKEWDSKSIKEHEEKMINLLMAQNFSHPLPSV